MSARADPVAELIPWYAAGSLEPAACSQVEAHLAGCEPCRDLLSVARAFRRQAPHVRFEGLFEHIQAQRLVEFAENPAQLEPDTRRFITTHIQTCRPCAEALEILEQLALTPGEIQGGGRERGGRQAQGGLWQTLKGFWRRMAATVLHPVPAMAYLALVIALAAFIQFRPESPVIEPGEPERPVVSLIPPAFELSGEVLFRGEGQAPPPAEIAVADSSGLMTLALVTDMDREDLGDPSISMRVEIAQGDLQVLNTTRPVADIDARGRLLELIDPGAIAPGIPCSVRLTLVKPGDPRHGEEIYRRSFRLVPAPAPRPGD